ATHLGAGAVTAALKEFVVVCLWPLSLAAFSLLGCQTKSSADLATDDLGVQIEAQAQSSGVTELSVALRKAEGITSQVELSDEDMLLARLGNVEQVLKKRSNKLGRGTHYVATLPGNAEGAAVTVRLVRAKHGDASAHLVLPAPIAVSYPRGDINF